MTPSPANEEHGLVKRDQGLFPNGTSWTSPDGMLTARLAPAQFCGTETLKNVASLKDPTKYVTTSMKAYFDDLNKADMVTRKTMVKNTALRVATRFTTSCAGALHKQQSSRLLTRDAQDSQPAVATVIKLAGLAALPGVNLAIIRSVTNSSFPVIIMAQVGVIFINRAIFKIIRAMDDPEAVNLLIDAREALTMALLALTVDPTISYLNRLITAGCSATDENDLEQASMALGGWEAKDSNIRPISQVNQVYAQPGPNNCPNLPMEAGITGEVIG